MFNGPEIWILLLIVLPIILIAFVSSNQRKSRLAANAAIDGSQFHRDARTVHQEALLRLGRVPTASVRSHPDGSLLVERQVYPGWTIVVAVLFFPLGLLALLAKRTESVTLLFREIQPQPDPLTELRVAGLLTKPMVTALQNPPIAAGSPSPSTLRPSVDRRQAPTQEALPTVQVSSTALPPGPAPLPHAPKTSAVPPPPAPPAGWFPDPHGRYEQRYWDGTMWTDSVLVDGVSILEPSHRT